MIDVTGNQVAFSLAEARYLLLEIDLDNYEHLQIQWSLMLLEINLTIVDNCYLW